MNLVERILVVLRFGREKPVGKASDERWGWRGATRESVRVLMIYVACPTLFGKHERKGNLRMARAPVIGIDVIRFAAATSVVLWHFAAKPFLTPMGSTLHPLLSVLPQTPPGVVFSWWGWIGVQVFFVISGAVIAYSAEGANPKSFFIGRFSRLWPTMFVCASICAVLSAVFWKTPIFHELELYLSSIVFNPLGPWVSGQIWTLPIEIVFYCLVWVVIYLKRVTQIEYLAWLLACESAIYWILVSWFGDGVINGKLAQLSLAIHGCYFAMGMTLARGTTQRFTVSRILLVIICASTGVREIIAHIPAELAESSYKYYSATPCVVWLMAVAAIWASMQWRDRLASQFAKFGVVFRLLGGLTYPLYLVHYQTGGPLFAYAFRKGLGLWPSFVFAYILALAVAFVVYTWVEPLIQSPTKASLKWALGVKRESRTLRNQ